MISKRWRDTKAKGKVIKEGISKDHKYLDRSRTMAFQQTVIDAYLDDFKDSEGKACKVLDISTGTGLMVELMNDLGHKARGTEIPDCPFQPFHKSQQIDVIYHDSAKKFPFKNKEFDLVICIGAVSCYPEEKIPSILEDIFRIAKSTVLIGVNRGEIYDRIKELFDKVPNGWKLTIQKNTFYRWDHE